MVNAYERAFPPRSHHLEESRRQDVTMGYDVDIFVDSVSENFKCVICRDVLKNPVTACHEGHTFCQSCLAPVQRCPLDRQELLPKRPRNRPLEDLIAEMRVRCVNCCTLSGKKRPREEKSDANEVETPGWQGPLRELQKHTEHECAFTVIPCKHHATGCPRKLERRLAQEHEKDCQYREVECERCCIPFLAKELPHHACPKEQVVCVLCGASYLREDIEYHDIFECPEAEIACELEPLGCRAKFKRKDQQQHTRSFQAKHLEMAIATSVKQQYEIAALKTERKKRFTELKHRMSEPHESCRFFWTAEVSKLRFGPYATASAASDEMGGLGRTWRLCMSRNSTEPDWVGFYVIAMERARPLFPGNSCVFEYWLVQNKKELCTGKFMEQFAISGQELGTGVHHAIKYSVLTVQPQDVEVCVRLSLVPQRDALSLVPPRDALSLVP